MVCSGTTSKKMRSRGRYAIVPAEDEVEFAAELNMPMKTADQVAADIAVLLTDVSSSGTGAPPYGGAVDWSVGGEPPGDVTVWGW
jgi:hypothetical protein